VALFVDRAQAVRPDFQVTARNAAAVAALCQQLEGLPLAIELAAVRAGALTPQQILARLGERFELLVSRQRVADRRHHSLRAALDWSYQLLTPELQRFFARLSVFRGGWTLEVAAAVCGGEGVGDADADSSPSTPQLTPTLEGLEQLRECSLVRAVEEGEEIRYLLLETMREYGWKRLQESGEAEAVRQRHAGYFTHLAEQGERGWATPEQPWWWDRIEREHDNMRAALAWCAERQEAETGLRLAGALHQFWWHRGYHTEGRAHLETMLALPGAERSKTRVKVLRWAGHAAERYGDQAAGFRLFEQSLALAREIGDREGIAYVLATTRFPSYEESLAIFRELNHPHGIGSTLLHMGHAALRRSDWEAARTPLVEALVLFREMGHPSCTAWALFELGQLAEGEGDLETSWQLCQECLSLYRELRLVDGIAKALRQLGRLALRRQEWEIAQAIFDECLALNREMGSRIRMSGSQRDLGLVACARQDWAEARARLEESLALTRQVGDDQETVACLETLAEITGGEGQAERGARLLGAADAFTEATGRTRWPAEREVYERSIALLRALLGEGAFAAARAEGQRLSMEQAIGLAVGRERGPRF
jgi:tetratricopeptide (TPR) repeat protein